MRQASRERGGAAVAERLRARREEIEQAGLLRVQAVSAMPRGGGPEYAEGLRAAVSAGLDYGLAGIEHGEEAAPPIPETLLAQARLAARSGVSLDTVLRRYLAGHTLLDDFLIEEAERAERLDRPALKRLLRSQAAIVDRLLAAVSAAYTDESERQSRGIEPRKADRVERLLAGELLDASDLGYDIDGHHLGAIAVGPEAAEAIRALAAALDRRLLLVERGEDALWAWLGGGHRLDSGALFSFLSSQWPDHLALALGEPGRGLVGWQLTHRQARAALPICLRTAGRHPVRYGDVALLATALQDDLLATSLRRLYLAPLEQERDGGEAARKTLRAYFASGRNVSSAAAALGVTRQTVTNRLHVVEDRIGRALVDCGTEVEVALRLQDVGSEILADG